MSGAFGQHDTQSGTAAVADGTYDAVVESCKLVERNGQPAIDGKSGKKKVKIVVAIGNVTLPRTTNIAFGANSESGKWATFAEFIEAATGIKCGDPKQKDVEEADVVGKRLRVTVLENSKGYADIVRFKAIPPAEQEQRRAEPAAARIDRDAKLDEPDGSILAGTAGEILDLSSALKLKDAIPRWYAKASKGRTEKLHELTEVEAQVVLGALRMRIEEQRAAVA